MSFLLVIKGPKLGVRYELGERTRIGRLGENEIQVVDPNVSRVHAEVVRSGDRLAIFDRGSRNGLWVNGEEVQEKDLTPGDVIEIGNTVFAFQVPYEIRNARFTDNSVYLFDAGEAAVAESNLRTLDGTEGEAADLLTQFSRVFAVPPASIGKTAAGLAAGVKSLLKADRSLVMLRDANGEVRPLAALPDERPVAVPQQLIDAVVKTGKPMLFSGEVMLPPMADESSTPPSAVGTQTQEPARQLHDTGTSRVKTVHSEIEKELAAQRQKAEHGEKPFQVTFMAAPLLKAGQVTGAIVIESHGLNRYTQQNLAVLRTVATLAETCFEVARLVDSLNIVPPDTTPTDYMGGLSGSRSLRLQEILNAARRSADSPVTVMISGEPGTGKELLARFIHQHSPWNDGPFVRVDCANFTPEELERELFGAATGVGGVEETIPGKIEAAEGGTLYLAEIGDLDVELQPKLLRFLQDKAFYRVYGNRAIHANARIVASSSTDLPAAVRAGDFREDLWYRLNVVPFNMPPLRERREDIAHLMDHLVARYSARHHRNVLGANDGAIALLQKYDWPGNIVELENAVERAVLLAQGRILTTADFGHIEEARRRMHEQSDLERKRETRPLTEVERQHIIIALKKFNYNQAKAAEALGLHRNTLRNKIIEYGIEIPK